MQCPTLRGVASKTIELFSKNTCVGDIELLLLLLLYYIDNLGYLYCEYLVNCLSRLKVTGQQT